MLMAIGVAGQPDAASAIDADVENLATAKHFSIETFND